MFDFGWAELFLIGLILLLVIGPKDIPNIMYQGGKMMRHLGYMRFALSQQFEDFMQAQDAKEHGHAEPEKENRSAEPEKESFEMNANNPFFVEADEEADTDGEALFPSSCDDVDKKGPRDD
jgi:sec-independent protein translocase protein TatB